MNAVASVANKMRDARARSAARRRFVAGLLLGALTIVVPVVAAVAPLPHRFARAPMLDRRAIENLQRWVNGDLFESRKEEKSLATLEIRRESPDFAASRLALVSWRVIGL